MQHPTAIRATGLGITYNLELTQTRTLKSVLFHTIRDRRAARKERVFWALKDVTFSSKVGDVLGVVGRNGSGKSTLLLAIAGILRPDRGSIETAGYRSNLLTLGAGFENWLTGRENIYLNAALLGIRRRVIESKIDDIVEFSELGRFIDAPLRQYSTGMRLRLGFAIAVNTEPELLIMDEALSVGDLAFQEKSKTRLHELMHTASSIVIATHDMEVLREMCTVAIWLDGGAVAAFGDPDEVARQYEQYLESPSSTPVRAVASG